MGKKSKKISIVDIANSLNVSKTLVSMVLNGHGDKNGISPKTQEKVWKKTKELNYKPNQIARGLRLGISNTLGLIVADISNPFYARIARSIEDYASKQGYNLIICSSEEKEEKEIQLLRMLRSRQVDGVIISSTLSDHSEILSMKQENYPFVLIDRYFPRIDTNYVIVDNYRGAFEAVEHLIKLGYKKIAQLTISPAHITSLKDRTKGYKDALKKHNIRYNKKYDCEIPFSNIKENLTKELQRLTSTPDNVQAIFVANNNLAVTCLECLNEMNLMIPRDVAIVSFDDIRLFAFTYSPITAIAQPIDEICSKSVEILINEITSKGKALKQHIVLPPELKVRHSCGRLSGRVLY